MEIANKDEVPAMVTRLKGKKKKKKVKKMPKKKSKVLFKLDISLESSKSIATKVTKNSRSEQKGIIAEYNNNN